MCDGGLQSVLWVLMESSKAATGLACSPQNHSVLVRLRRGPGLREGEAAALGRGVEGRGSQGDGPRGNKMGSVPGVVGRCRVARLLAAAARCLPHPTTAPPFPRLPSSLSGARVSPAEECLSALNYPPRNLISLPSSFPALDQQRLNSS